MFAKLSLFISLYAFCKTIECSSFICEKNKTINLGTSGIALIKEIKTKNKLICLAECNKIKHCISAAFGVTNGNCLFYNGIPNASQFSTSNSVDFYSIKGNVDMLVVF